MKGSEMAGIDIWGLLFERPSLDFPPNHVIFQSTTPNGVRTYQDVRQKSAQFGNALQTEWGWQKGDVLVVMAPNHIDTPAVTWGCHYAGGTVCPVNPGLSTQDLRHQLKASRACGLVVHSRCLSVALEAAQLANLPHDRILVLESDLSVDTFGILSTAKLTDLAQSKITTLRPRVSINPSNDVAYLVYSSGTTGRPKGVEISHLNVVAAVLTQAAVDEKHIDWRSSRTLAVLPVFHIYGLVCLVHLPIYLGTTTLFMERFEIDHFCHLIQNYRISHAYVAPPIVLHLTKSPSVEKYNLTSLRMLTSGGAPLAANLIRELFQRRGIPIRQAYGLSETTSVSHIQRWDDWRNGIGSNGPPIPGLEAKFALGDGRSAPPGEEGELLVRGPTVFKSYRDDSDMTSKSLTDDGWFQTGDIGYEDDNHNMFITDRSKDLIKYKGYQVAPVELEDLLLKNEMVDDVAVIGIMNHDLASEVPLAFVVLKAGKKEDIKAAQELQDFVKDHTIHYKQLRGGIIFTREIPKGPSGKILKRVLRERANGPDKARRLVVMKHKGYDKAAKLSGL